MLPAPRLSSSARAGPPPTAGTPWAGSPTRSRRELLDPADRVVVDRVRADRVPTEAADRVAYEMVRRTGLTMVPRTIAIDDGDPWPRRRSARHPRRGARRAGLADARAGRGHRVRGRPPGLAAGQAPPDRRPRPDGRAGRPGGRRPGDRTPWPRPGERRLRSAGRDHLGVGGGRALPDRGRRAGDGRPDRGAVRAGQPARRQLPGEVVADERHACRDAAAAARVPTAGPAGRRAVALAVAAGPPAKAC